MTFKEAHRAEARPIDRYFLRGDPIAHQTRGYRRQQNAAAKMPCGNQQALQIRGTDDREMIRRVGAQSGPGFFDARVGQSGHYAHHVAKDQFHPAGSDVVVEPSVLDGGTGDESAVSLWNQIFVLEPEDVLDGRGLAAESDHLAFCRCDWSVGRSAADFGGKAACRDDRPLRFDSVFFQNQTFATTAFFPE